MYISNKEHLDLIFKDNETLVYQDYDCGSMDINIGPQPGATNIFLCYFKTWDLDDFPLTIGWGIGVTLPTVSVTYQGYIGVNPTPNFFIGIQNQFHDDPRGPNFFVGGIAGWIF